MKNIRVIKGIYGYRKEGSNITTPKGKTDPAFEVSDDEAKRLVELGVAVVVDEPSENTDSTGNAGAAFTQSALRRINKAGLEALAIRRGLDISGATNNNERADMIFADIEKAKADGKEIDEDGCDIEDDTNNSSGGTDDGKGGGAGDGSGNDTDDEDEDDEDEDEEDDTNNDGEPPPNPGASQPVG